MPELSDFAVSIAPYFNTGVVTGVIFAFPFGTLFGFFVYLGIDEFTSRVLRKSNERRAKRKEDK